MSVQIISLFAFNSLDCSWESESVTSEEANVSDGTNKSCSVLLALEITQQLAVATRKRRRWCSGGFPSGWAPCPATGGVRADGPRSSRGLKLHPGGDIPRPNPWRRTSWWCTSWSARRLPQSHGWPTAREERQTPGCWRSWGCSRGGSCRQWSGGTWDGKSLKCWSFAGIYPWW